MTTDLAVLPDHTDLDRAADPANYVLAACERAKAWLEHALEHGDIEQIVELRSQADAIRVYTMSKQLGKDAQLAAAEIVRRAERGLGLAVRRGQANGEVKTQADGGWSSRKVDSRDETKKSVKGIFTRPQERADTYAMTDGVSSEVFDAALDEARAEGNLSRRNVVRKVRARLRSDETPEPRDHTAGRSKSPELVPGPTAAPPRCSAAGN